MTFDFTYIRWAFGVICILTGSWIAVRNWSIFVHNQLLHRAWGEPFFLSGGLSCVVGLALCPISVNWYDYLAPLLLDWGSFPGMLFEFVRNCRRRFQIALQGRAGLIYTENGQKYFIDSEMLLGKHFDIIIYEEGIKRYDLSLGNAPVTATERKRIFDNTVNYFRSKGFGVEADTGEHGLISYPRNVRQQEPPNVKWSIYQNELRIDGEESKLFPAPIYEVKEIQGTLIVVLRQKEKIIDNVFGFVVAEKRWWRIEYSGYIFPGQRKNSLMEGDTVRPANGRDNYIIAISDAVTPGQVVLHTMLSNLLHVDILTGKPIKAVDKTLKLCYTFEGNKFTE